MSLFKNILKKISKKNIMETMGFIEFRGKWISTYKAKKIMKAASISSLKEAHNTFQELNSKLQKKKK